MIPLRACYKNLDASKKQIEYYSKMIVSLEQVDPQTNKKTIQSLYKDKKIQETKQDRYQKKCVTQSQKDNVCLKSVREMALEYEAKPLERRVTFKNS